MAEKPTAPENEAGVGELRGQLVKRLAIAGGLVAILLGVLAVFDRLATTSEEVDSPVFTQPVPVPPKKEVTQPVTAASNLPEPPVAPVAPAEEPAPAPQLEVPAATKIEKAPEGKAEIRSPARPTATIVSPVPAPLADSSPRQHSLPGAVKREPAPVPEESAPPVISPAPSALEAKPAPSARIAEMRSAASNPPSSAQRLFSGFLLQAGVFTSAQRAEELHARLTLSGVPSTLETRVQVGPFRTRQEAESAQEKLKQLGIESLLIPPKGAKN